MTTKSKHISVLLQPTIESLSIKPKGLYVDATLGGAGHTREILEQMKWQGKLLVFDQDNLSVDNFIQSLVADGFVASKTCGVDKLTKKELEIYIATRNFSELKNTIYDLKLGKVDGIIADLGLSTDQLKDEVRGFSYLANGKLDMRMSSELIITAADLLNGLYEKELEELFFKLGDVDFAKKLARAVIKSRNLKPIANVSDLKYIVQRIVPSSSRLGTNKHPEAKVFQALRIAVNDELNHLRKFLPQALEALGLGGRLSIITFHSGEDRIVKNYFRDQIQANQAKYIYKILKASESEIEKNSRSHSAKLRSIEKI